ncbi:MAG: YmdB family metallophosphoesterase [Desulfovibrio sp.]|jgi:metallophosphoesterase (TIGR00282 family)|nr:YmdB family metallophosphoesterase [Desulfovibrio sp.]
MLKQQGICRILCLGDVVGGPGRRAIGERLPGLRAELTADMVIANGENASGGIGLTPANFQELLAAGVDVVTSGNHIWKYKEMHACLNTHAAALRPANYGDAVPGKGFGLYSLPDGINAGVLNLIGRVFMEPVNCPFQAADAALSALAGKGAHFCLVDFHAEASSEKRAMVHYLDGRAAAVLGTHTHVQTADFRVSPLGTAGMTDLGMCGVEEDSIIGMDKEVIIKRFVTGLPQSFKLAKGSASLNGAIIDIDAASGKAAAIHPLRG